MQIVPYDWTPMLAVAIADSVRELAATKMSLAALDLGCFPWHGRLELSALTEAGAMADPALLDGAEVATWLHYDFAEGMPAWRAATDLGRRMYEAYQMADVAGRPRVVEAFLAACAAAASSVVTLAVTDRVGVPVVVRHPDSGHVFAVGQPRR